jgi:hypothetical protein
MGNRTLKMASRRSSINTRNPQNPS